MALKDRVFWYLRYSTLNWVIFCMSSFRISTSSGTSLTQVVHFGHVRLPSHGHDQLHKESSHPQRVLRNLPFLELALPTVAGVVLLLVLEVIDTDDALVKGLYTFRLPSTLRSFGHLHLLVQLLQLIEEELVVLREVVLQRLHVPVFLHYFQ